MGRCTYSVYRGTLLLKVHGRKQLVRISSEYVTFLGTKPNTPTKYVRNVTTRDKKPPVPEPVNKFKQKLSKDDVVVGVAKGHHSIVFGRVSRWTQHNIWIIPDVGKGKENNKTGVKEVQLDSIKQCFKMEDDGYKKALTFAAMKGWDGS